MMTQVYKSIVDKNNEEVENFSESINDRDRGLHTDMKKFGNTMVEPELPEV